MSEYYIPDYVHFAYEGDTVVFMDIRADQYRMLTGDKGRAFIALLSRTAASIQRIIRVDHSDRDDMSETIHCELLDDLLKHGLVTTQRRTSGSLVPAVIAVPQEDLLDSSTGTSIIRIIDIWSFLFSCATAKLRLSCSTIEHTIRAIERRKRLRGIPDRFDFNEARRLVRTYNRLRPLVPKDYHCLFDSLSLIEFLARHDCYPNWIFAVQLQPWAAHCWVQYETLTFNETADEARTYLPLISI